MLRKRPAPTDMMRDDNLVLLHAEPMRRALDERDEDLKTGAMMLLLFILATLFAGVSLAGSQSPFETVMGLYGVLFWVAVIAAALSPIVATLLLVEWRNLRRDRDQFDALLRRYNRI